MLRAPIFCLQADTDIECFDVYQNYLCPHYALCTEEASGQSLSLNCRECAFNKNLGEKMVTEGI